VSEPIDVTAIDRLRSEFIAELPRVTSDRDWQALRDKYVGRKQGAVTALLKTVASAPVTERPALGRLVNELKQQIERELEERRASLDEFRAPAGAVDVTLPGRAPLVGRRHPLTIVRDEIDTIFTRMGYQVLEGDELEDDYHNFEALNMPPEHPARDMQDTLYLAKPVNGRTLLRTHTSGMQIRYMKARKPPVRIIAPGKVYRRDNLDVTHTPMFTQVEGLVVDEGITLADLKGTLAAMARELFGENTPVQFRPSFFPYTEPSAEVFIGCQACGGSGCAVCKRTGWLEIGGSGMVHPYLFEAVGYDPERYSGFAFGMGVERIAMLRYKVDDIRLFYENDLRFLEQFPA
jgi:phenylalanyl-tRNA synthetase alpha chain